VLTGKPDAEPLRDAAVVLDALGRVVAVGPSGELKQRYAQASWQVHRAILLPGLVNAHVHLELSALRGETRSGGGFGPWVTSMMEARARLLPEQDADAIEAAVSELLRTGTVAVGEVTNSLAAVPSLASAPLLGRVFHEIYGLGREAAETMLKAAQAARADLSGWPENLSYALCPHTLYSLHADAVRRVLALSRGHLTSLHLSEHAAERAYLRDGTGPFADFLKARNVDTADFRPPGLSPVDYARQLGALSPEVIAVHLCATTRPELLQVAESGAPVVLCPRSNLFIELKLPPLFDMLQVGLRPGLGSDSLASNTSLDVLAEAAALHDRFPQVDAKLLFSMATWYGAVALGLSHRVGALCPGLTPGLLAVDVERADGDPLQTLLRSPPPARRVLARPALPTPQRPLGEPP
jgi:cytosine/adenosine deaminase-related metal-dependent hydrolase